MKLAQELIRFGQQLADEDSAAHDLWTWLPSRRVADKHHGDQSSNFQPSNRDVMVEAAMYLAHLRHPNEALTTEQQKWFSQCPCGEDHEES